MLVILRSQYRAQKPLKPGNKKNMRRKLRNPPPQVGPRKNDKTKREGSFPGHFRTFCQCFHIFEAPRGVGLRNFSFFSRIFRQGSESPESEREGLGVKKPPFPTTPEKGVPSQKSPSLYKTRSKMGFFSLGTPFFGWWEMGFLTPKPSSSDSGDFDPCKGSWCYRRSLPTPELEYCLPMPLQNPL